MPLAQAGLKEPVINVSQAAPQLLRTLFLHHDGIVLGATIAALYKPGLLTWLWRKKRLSVREILVGFAANAGYLHVALRSLAMQGWLNRHGTPASVDLIFEVTKAGEIAAEAFATYAEVGEFVYSGVPMDEILFGGANAVFARMADQCRQGWGLPADRGDPHRQALFATIRQQLDGLLLGPLMIAFKRRGLLEGEYFPLAKFPAAQEICWRGSSCCGTSSGQSQKPTAGSSPNWGGSPVTLRCTMVSLFPIGLCTASCPS